MKYLFFIFCCTIPLLAESRPEIVWTKEIESDSLYRPRIFNMAFGEDRVLAAAWGWPKSSEGTTNFNFTNEYYIFDSEYSIESTFEFHYSNDYTISRIDVRHDSIFFSLVDWTNGQYYELVNLVTDLNGNILSETKYTEKVYNGSAKYRDGYFIYGWDVYSAVPFFDKFDSDLELESETLISFEDVKNTIDISQLTTAEHTNYGAIFAFPGPTAPHRRGEYSVLIGYDKTGEILWERKLQHDGFDSTQIISMKQTMDNDYLLLMKSIKNNTVINWSVEMIDNYGNPIAKADFGDIGSNTLPEFIYNEATGQFLLGGYYFFEDKSNCMLKAINPVKHSEATYYWADASYHYIDHLFNLPNGNIMAAGPYNKYSTFLSEINIEVIDVNEDVNHVNISVYPNPSNENIVIDLGRQLTTTDMTISIINSTGRTVNKFGSKYSNQIVLSTNSLPAGIYYIQIETQNSIITEQIVVL